MQLIEGVCWYGNWERCGCNRGGNDDEGWWRNNKIPRRDIRFHSPRLHPHLSQTPQATPIPRCPQRYYSLLLFSYHYNYSFFSCLSAILVQKSSMLLIHLSLWHQEHSNLTAPLVPRDLLTRWWRPRPSTYMCLSICILKFVYALSTLGYDFRPISPVVCLFLNLFIRSRLRPEYCSTRCSFGRPSWLAWNCGLSIGWLVKLSPQQFLAASLSMVVLTTFPRVFTHMMVCKQPRLFTSHHLLI